MLPVLNSSRIDFRTARLVWRVCGSPMDPVEELYKTEEGAWILRTFQGWTPDEQVLSLLRPQEATEWLDRRGHLASFPV